MSNITRIFRRFLFALSFLTILPIPLIFFRRDIEKKENISTDFSKASVFFPLVGLLIGGILYSSDLLLKYINLPVHLRIGLLLAIWVFSSGGLHLEGFADMVDGFSGGENKKDIITIMKDGSIGAKGAIALIIFILLKFLLLSSLSEPVGGAILLFIPVIGRWSMVLAAYLGEPASSSNTLTRLFTNYLGKKELLISTSLTVVISIIIFSPRQLFYQPITLLIISALITSWMVGYSNKKIGGICGDVIGAVNEITELITLIASLLLIK